jgi:hypothetical protein
MNCELNKKAQNDDARAVKRQEEADSLLFSNAQDLLDLERVLGAPVDTVDLIDDLLGRTAVKPGCCRASRRRLVARQLLAMRRFGLRTHPKSRTGKTIAKRIRLCVA